MMETNETARITYYITIRGYELTCLNCGKVSNLSLDSDEDDGDRWINEFIEIHKDCPLPMGDTAVQNELA